MMLISRASPHPRFDPPRSGYPATDAVHLSVATPFADNADQAVSEDALSRNETSATASRPVVANIRLVNVTNVA
ncbi:hypothetical protein [Sphingomonas sp. CFBP 8760]|uniref:hypothetical protein n=1 Tax=Sphingomonas sp. CFBP 8760 TaxID=2775282 RepID=UPI001A927BA4|nr:hypothetical protein [Sphingomonas sp. CFBP 8760]